MLCWIVRAAAWKKLTEDLVEASKASSGALPVDLQPTDVSVLFDQIVGEYQERLADCRLTLVARPPEQALSVCADGKLLSRVMDNLMSNICKYALEDTVSTPWPPATRKPSPSA